jgi:hypothetical protein
MKNKSAFHRTGAVIGSNVDAAEALSAAAVSVIETPGCSDLAFKCSGRGSRTGQFSGFGFTSESCTRYNCLAAVTTIFSKECYA